MIDRYARPQMRELWSDQNRYQKWLDVEILAAEAWERSGKIPAGTAARLRQSARVDARRVDEHEAIYHHDMLAFISAVSETVDAEDAKYIHFGLTSTDVVDTALASLMTEALDIILDDLQALEAAVRRRAVENRRVAVIGRTHGIHAEPTSHGLKWALWWLELGRDRERIQRARDTMAVMKLSGPVGNYASLPPEIEAYVGEKMGLRPDPLSTQVLQRDRHAEVITSLAILGSTLDKMATEIRHSQRTEVGELEEPFSQGQRGSSAMPHKKNPIKCEQISGLSRLLRGYVVPALEDMPLWYERDISHSSVERVMIPDATTLADYLLVQMTRIVEGLTIHADRMRQNLERSGGLVFSGKVLLALVDGGFSRDHAYEIVQRHALAASQEPQKSFRERLLDDPEVQERVGAEKLASLFDVEPYLSQVDTIYRRLGLLTDEGGRA
ncbi:adenylosuccinate lyase [Sulfobacillus harzensis]|uniref:Adenylosuccinate lyase n=1 Tax=Sulfobacillus harzensis TaxID=2729629 RepID=A0A7Y0L7N4_9FIRM|nr:adenylosuccinate lyase [Sulfobacillus harzensis]NMP23925.1 adenylosuccinate lyase [Sulfobacillus harzensis]